MLQHAHTHEQLLRALEEVDSAHARLTQNLLYIRDLDAQIAAGTQTCKKARYNAVVESIGYERYRDSHVRKYAYKMTGRGNKWDKYKSKEEQEYLEALQKQKDAEEDLGMAKQLRAEARAQTKVLEKEMQRHGVLLRELDGLYDALFAGATGEFADVGEKMERLNVAQRIYDEQKPVIPHERQILDLLRHINEQANVACDRLDEAETASLADLGGGGGYISSMKRENLKKTAEEIKKLRSLQHELTTVAPDIPALATVEVVSPGSATTEILFDNVFTDMDAHTRIKKASRQLDATMRQVQDLLREKEAYFKQLTKDFEKAEGDRDAARADLHHAALEAFRKVQDGEEMDTAAPLAALVVEEPPPYSA